MIHVILIKSFSIKFMVKKLLLVCVHNYMLCVQSQETNGQFTEDDHTRGSVESDSSRNLKLCSISVCASTVVLFVKFCRIRGT